MSASIPSPAILIALTLTTLALATLAGCQTAAPMRETIAENASAAQSCGAAFASLGYQDGLAGRPARGERSGCPAADRRAYADRYAAGLYVAGAAQRNALGADTRTARTMGGAGSSGGGGSLGGLARRDPRELALPAGCAPGEARAAGRLGLTQPAPCPNLPAVADSFAVGRADARGDARFRSLDLEQQRLENQLRKPFLSAAERRLIERRLNTIDRNLGVYGTQPRSILSRP